MGKRAVQKPTPSLQALRKQRRTAAWSLISVVPAGAAVSAPVVAVVFAVVALFCWRRWRQPTAFQEVLPLPRLNASRSDALALFADLYRGRKPVVIEGALAGWPAANWSAASLAFACPSAQLPVYSYDLNAKDWAGLKDAGKVFLHDYLTQELGEASSRPRDARYGLEMSLRSECPALLADVRIPAFFADDLLVRHYKRGAWPTLIAGPRGTRSGLHRDTHDLPFWMALFVGRKRWRIFDADEPALRPHYRADRNGFSFDPFAPDFAQHPDLAAARVYEHELQGGELLYIPNGAPHAASNVDDSIAISGNYLDPSSLERHKHVTCAQALWQDSNLCWFYEKEFEQHRAVPIGELQELSYFQFAGFTGPTAWCASFLEDLRDRAQRHPELERNLRIVQGFCASLAQ